MSVDPARNERRALGDLSHRQSTEQQARERLADAISDLTPKETAVFVGGMVFALQQPSDMVLKMIAADDGHV